MNDIFSFANLHIVICLIFKSFCRN